VSKVTEKIKTPSKPTPSENFNSHPLLSITTNTTQTFIHTLIEKGNSQPFNNNLKIYKNQFSHI
jgi:hypothetical protein